MTQSYMEVVPNDCHYLYTSYCGSAVSRSPRLHFCDQEQDFRTNFMVILGLRLRLFKYGLHTRNLLVIKTGIVPKLRVGETGQSCWDRELIRFSLYLPDWTHANKKILMSIHSFSFFDRISMFLIFLISDLYQLFFLINQT